MARYKRTIGEKLRDKEAQLQRTVETNVAWDYVNNMHRKENERLRCRLEYLEKMEAEIGESSGDNNAII